MGTGPSNAYTVDSSGDIPRFDGKAWSKMISGARSYLNGVWGASASSVFVVGNGGTILNRCVP